MAKLLSPLILLLASLLGMAAFLFPFFQDDISQSSSGLAHAGDAPFFFGLLLLLCLVVIVANLETRQMNAKIIAALGILAAIGGLLRLIPGPGGFSPVYFLIILCGYVYGADFGFIVGVMTILVSAVVTSGIGPWLAFQMFTAGWMGLASGWLPDMARLDARLEAVLLAIWGGLWGLAFGAIMNLWFWPYYAQPGLEASAWQAGAGLLEGLRRYSLFYLTTSLWWDMGRAAGNVLLLLLLGPPILRLLRRFQKRFHFEIAAAQR